MKRPGQGGLHKMLADHDSEQAQQLSEILRVSQHPDRQSVADEFEGAEPATAPLSVDLRLVLQSIYGEDAIRLWNPPTDSTAPRGSVGTLRYEFSLK